MGGTELYFTDFDMTLDNPEFNENELKNNVVLYPNPTTGTFHIKTPDNSQISQVKIYDLLGKEMSFSTQNNSELDLSSLNDGIYLVKVYTDNSIYTSKIVVKK